MISHCVQNKIQIHDDDLWGLRAPTAGTVSGPLFQPLQPVSCITLASVNKHVFIFVITWLMLVPHPPLVCKLHEGRGYIGFGHHYIPNTGT